MRVPLRLPHRLSLLLSLLCPLLAGAQDFRFTSMDIGQGDAAVLVAPGGCAVLFDGGPTGSGTVIKNYLKELGVKRVDMAFVSHLHADHMGGIDEVDVGPDAVPITAVYDHGGTGTTATYNEYATHFQGRRITALRGQTFSVCGQVMLTVVASGGNGVPTDDENSRSVAVKITYGAFDALVGGDLTATPDDIESTMLDDLGELELYKVHHHGSRYSSGNALLDKTVPVVSFISVGWNNTYGHPTRECLDRLTAHHSEVWQTEDPASGQVLGHIQLSSRDGSTFVVQQGTRSVSYVSRGVQQGPDEIPPSAPRALKAGALSSDSIELRWTAATDNVGVATYYVYRNQVGTVGYQQAGSVATLAFVDMGLTPGAGYTYQVLAVDAAGNGGPTASITVRTPTPRVTVTSPNGGEKWGGTSTHDITWISIGYPRVSLDYTLDNGATWTPIATDLDASTGKYAWTLPNALSTVARVRVRDVGGRASDTSDGQFSLIAAPPPARVILNEILANEPGSATAGEFVELVNIGGSPADIGGWVIRDATNVRHVFAAGTQLAPGKAIVVFGGAAGIPAGTPNAVVSSTGTLSLNNAEDTVTVQVSSATNAESKGTFTWKSQQPDGVSLNRSPDTNPDGAFVLHTTLSTSSASGGRRANGSDF